MTHDFEGIGRFVLLGCHFHIHGFEEFFIQKPTSFHQNIVWKLVLKYACDSDCCKKSFGLEPEKSESCCYAAAGAISVSDAQILFWVLLWYVGFDSWLLGFQFQNSWGYIVRVLYSETYLIGQLSAHNTCPQCRVFLMSVWSNHIPWIKQVNLKSWQASLKILAFGICLYGIHELSSSRLKEVGMSSIENFFLIGTNFVVDYKVRMSWVYPNVSYAPMAHVNNEMFCYTHMSFGSIFVHFLFMFFK